MNDMDEIDMGGTTGGMPDGSGTPEGGGMPDGYVDHLRARRTGAVDAADLPSVEDALASARAREASGASSGAGVSGGAEVSHRADGGSTRWVMAAAAAIVVVLIGVAAVLVTRNTPVTVDTAGPGDGATMPDGQGGSAAGQADPLAGIPLLFPSGDLDQMQARVGADPDIPESVLTIDAAAETLVSGNVGERARLVSVVSGSPSAIDNVLDMLSLRGVVGFINDDGPVDTEYIRDQVMEQFLPPDGGAVEGRSVEVREVPTVSTPHTGPVVEVWIRINTGSPVDTRVVRIPGETSTTLVLGSNVDEQTIDGVVEGLVEEGGLLRVGDVPTGLERFGERSASNSLGWSYATVAPPGSGQRGSTLLQADRQDMAGLKTVMMTRYIGGPGTPVVLRSGPDWVIGTVGPTIVMGVRDGLWVTVGDFMIHDADNGLDADGRASTSTIDRLMALWDGMQSADRSVFDAALGRAADARAGGGTDLFGSQDQATITTEPTVTTVVGDSGD